MSVVWTIVCSAELLLWQWMIWIFVWVLELCGNVHKFQSWKIIRFYIIHASSGWLYPVSAFSEFWTSLQCFCHVSRSWPELWMKFLWLKLDFSTFPRPYQSPQKQLWAGSYYRLNLKFLRSLEFWNSFYSLLILTRWTSESVDEV